MKVLWFTNNSVNLNKKSTGGGWMQSLEHHISAAAGIELFIATRSNCKDLKIIRENSTLYYLIPDKRNKLKKRIDLLFNKEPVDRLIQQYLNIINEVKPDIIHIFGTEMEYGLISKFTKIPVVIHIQGILHTCSHLLMKNQVPFIKRLSVNKWTDYILGSTIRNGMKIFSRRTKTEKEIFCSCSYFIGRTAWDKKITNILSNNAQYFHCDEMIRNEYYINEWKGNTLDSIEIVSIISNPIYKGHDNIIETSEILKTAGVNFTWHIIGINKSSPSYRLYYKNKMRLLSGNIKFYGELQAADIIKILQDADVYIHPSHIENSSNSISEAMIIGMPVIAIYTGGNPSLIENGVNGLLVPDNDPYYLAAVIKEIKSNEEKYFQMAAKAKERAYERHDADKIINELKEIYRQIILIHENKK